MEVENNPIVSVIIPTYNRPDILKEALKSVFSQTYRNFEVIVVNDGGVDVMEIIDPLNNEGKIIYLYHKDNMGRSAARNTGLKAARGKYIAYLDDDDIYYPNHLETLVGCLENSDYNIAYTDSYQTFLTWSKDRYVTKGKKLTHSNDFDRQRLLINNFIPLLNIAHKKDVLDEARLFNEDLDTHEDWDLLIRLSQKYDFHHIQKITTEFRLRDDKTNTTTSNRASFLQTLKSIHSRYSHLVTDPSIIEDQKRVEESLAREVEFGINDSCIMHYESLHRYRLSREFVKGKRVLDLACGEGYGSFMLSEDAKSVTGIDEEAETIKRASSMYIKENLKFIKGSITEIPIEGEKIFDVIVCFSVLEHIKEHDKLMNEIKRLIKDDGSFIVSTPNKSISVDMHDYRNPFYAKELYFNEFKALLEKNFKNIHIYGQKVYPSSNIFPLFNGSGSTKDFVIERGDESFLFVPPSKKEARFLVAISSDSPIKDETGSSYLADISETLFKHKDTQKETLESVIKNKDTHIGNLETAMMHKDTHIGNLETAMMHKDTHIGNLETTLNHIYSSQGWKALSFYYKVRNKLLPLNSKRRLFARIVSNSILNPREFFRDLNKTKLEKLIYYLETSELAVLEKEIKISDYISYQMWIKKNEPSIDDLKKLEDKLILFKYIPKISIITPVYNTDRKMLVDMMESVLNQIYTKWELCIADGASSLPHVKEVLKEYSQKDNRIKVRFLSENKGIAGNCNEALALASGDFIGFLDHDDELTPFALYEVVKLLNENRDIDFIYSDEDKISISGKRFDHHFKPDWSPDTMRSYNYITHFTVIRRKIVNEVGGFKEGYEGSQDYDLFLRVIETTQKITHIPKVLYHWRYHEASTGGNPTAKMYAFESAKRALKEHIQRIGLNGKVYDGPFLGSYHIRYNIDSFPLVSIIIPTRDNVDVLKRCITSILHQSSYENYNIIIVDNQSRKDETFKYYKELSMESRIRILNYDKPFNFSAINNYAISQIDSEYIIFLNNDTEIISNNWIEAMLEFAQRNDVGAVGALLYYPNETIQHAGTIVGIAGFAGHSHRHFPRNTLGYIGRAKLIQNLSAVTAACLMVEKSIFEKVGGFDENYSHALNDVDLCMKIRQKGYLIIYTPYAELYHYESKSRGYENTTEKQARFTKEIEFFQKRWNDELAEGDPYYSPNLTLDREDFTIEI